MADVLLKPAFVATASDGYTPQIQPSAWNAARLFTGGADGQVLTRDSVSATGASWLSALPLTVDAIAAVSTDGFVLQNTTPATAGVPVQMGPRLRIRSHVWNTTTPADNTDDWRLEGIPTSGATPASMIRLSWSANGGAYADKLTINSSGNLVVGGSITGSGNITGTGSVSAGVAAVIQWTSVTQMHAPADGQLNLRNSGNSAGVGLDVATDAVLKVRTRAQSAYATLDCLGLKASGAAGVSFGPAHPASITIVNGIVTACS